MASINGSGAKIIKGSLARAIINYGNVLSDPASAKLINERLDQIGTDSIQLETNGFSFYLMRRGPDQRISTDDKGSTAETIELVTLRIRDFIEFGM